MAEKSRSTWIHDTPAVSRRHDGYDVYSPQIFRWCWSGLRGCCASCSDGAFASLSEGIAFSRRTRGCVPPCMQPCNVSRLVPTDEQAKEVRAMLWHSGRDSFDSGSKWDRVAAQLRGVRTRPQGAWSGGGMGRTDRVRGRVRRAAAGEPKPQAPRCHHPSHSTAVQAPRFGRKARFRQMSRTASIWYGQACPGPQCAVPARPLASPRHRRRASAAPP